MSFDVSFAMSSMRSTSACGVGTQMTSLPSWPTCGVNSAARAAGAKASRERNAATCSRKRCMEVSVSKGIGAWSANFTQDRDGRLGMRDRSDRLAEAAVQCHPGCDHPLHLGLGVAGFAQDLDAVLPELRR